ncbi:MAG: hypothetical protein ACTSPY_08385 [Candidatus Helarchaeota archaeon]
MKKFDLELFGTQLLGEIKEKISSLEESFNGGAFQDSINGLYNMLTLLKYMKKIIMGLRIYQEIYDVGG